MGGEYKEVDGGTQILFFLENGKNGWGIPARKCEERAIYREEGGRINDIKYI